jgi:hypothetical protein
MAFRSRVSARRGRMITCTHLDQVEVKQLAESVEGYEERMKVGDSWLHLRICLECGKVGCCDDSSNRHAPPRGVSYATPTLEICSSICLTKLAWRQQRRTSVVRRVSERGCDSWMPRWT